MNLINFAASEPNALLRLMMVLGLVVVCALPFLSVWVLIAGGVV